MTYTEPEFCECGDPISLCTCDVVIKKGGKMANDMMDKLVTDQKVRDLESLIMDTSVTYEQTILGLKDEIIALRETIKLMEEQNRLMDVIERAVEAQILGVTKIKEADGEDSAIVTLEEVYEAGRPPNRRTCVRFVPTNLAISDYNISALRGALRIMLGAREESEWSKP